VDIDKLLANRRWRLEIEKAKSVNMLKLSLTEENSCAQTSQHTFGLLWLFVDWFLQRAYEKIRLTCLHPICHSIEIIWEITINLFVRTPWAISCVLQIAQPVTSQMNRVDWVFEISVGFSPRSRTCDEDFTHMWTTLDCHPSRKHPRNARRPPEYWVSWVGNKAQKED